MWLRRNRHRHALSIESVPDGLQNFSLRSVAVKEVRSLVAEQEGHHVLPQAQLRLALPKAQTQEPLRVGDVAGVDLAALELFLEVLQLPFQLTQLVVANSHDVFKVNFG